MSKKAKVILLALFAMLLWGTLFPTVKLGFAAYEVAGTADILLFAGIRFTICGAAVCVYCALRDKKSYGPVSHSLLPVLLSGVFAIVLHYGFSYAGLQSTDSSKTALIKQVGSLVYVCVSFLFIKEDRPTPKKIVAAVMGFLGIVALNITEKGFTFAVGDLLILASSFCLIISNVISKRTFAKVSPMTATGVSQLFGGIVLLIVGLAMGGDVTYTLDKSLWIMVYICCASIVSYCVWYDVVKKSDLSNLLIIKFAEPVFACVFSAMILHENIWRLQYLAAFLLIGGGIWISQAKLKKKTKA